MSFVPLVAMGSLVFTFINLLKNVANKLWSPVVTQLISWLAGVVVVWLFAKTNWADTISFGGTPLSTLNAMSQFVIGLMAASLFGVVKDITKAIDQNDSAKTPPLLPPKP